MRNLLVLGAVLALAVVSTAASQVTWNPPRSFAYMPNGQLYGWPGHPNPVGFTFRENVGGRPGPVTTTPNW